ncbi:MAG: 50S ribosomal protein L15e [Candidatus Micrarchaeota archaeon]|nr:50S ribosomal protein L15e [Candidatus Micrarchaeota archaeon]
MGAYKYIKQTIIQEYKKRSESLRKKIIEWKKQPSVVRVEKPSNLPRARVLGYKPKQGFIIARVRIRKGKRKREKPAKGRKPGSNFRYVTRNESYQLIAEKRAQKKFTNLEVLNSYYIGEDGQYNFYEVILFDPNASTIKIPAKNVKRRVYRGLTYQGRKARGLINKG